MSSTSQQPSPSTNSQADAGDLNPAPSAGVSTTVVPPNIPDAQGELPSYSSHTEHHLQSDRYVQIRALDRMPQHHAGDNQLHTGQPTKEAEPHRINVCVRSTEDELDHVGLSCCHVSQSRPRPMMSDSDFYMLPEYTGSSDKETESSDVNHEGSEREQSVRQSFSFSSSSFGRQKLAPIEPPTIYLADEEGDYEAGSGPHNFSVLSDTFRHRVRAVQRIQDSRHTQSSPLRVMSPDRIGESRNPFRPGSAVQSSPPAALRRESRDRSDRILHYLVPARYSSLGATTINGGFSPGFRDFDSRERHAKTIDKKLSREMHIDGLDQISEIADSKPTHRNETHEPKASTQSISFTPYGGIPLPPDDPDAAPTVTVSLPSSDLDQIFASSDPNDAPRIPRIFMANAAPRVPHIFRGDLLMSPPKSMPDPNGRLPRVDGMMNLRDPDFKAQGKVKLSNEGSPTRPETSGDGIRMRMHSMDAQDNGEQSNRDGDKSPGRDTSFEAPSLPGLYSRRARLFDDDAGGASSNEFIDWGGSNPEYAPTSDPYDRSGAQNRSMFYDGE